MSAVQDEQVDLVVVGGGPTGMLSGVLARQLGVTVSIIDPKPSSLDLGRADAMNARTQQYFEVAGILDELRPKGIECNTSSTFSEGVFKSRQSHWWTGLQHAHHKNFLMLGQPDVEATLLKKLDQSVHYGEQVTSITEDDAGVTVKTDKGRTVRAKYAIGADGARSFVRGTLDIDFSGTKPEMVWAVLDTFLDTDFPVCSEIITFQLNGQSRVSWIPRERGMARFYILLDGEITQAKAEASIKEHMAPHRVDFLRTEWFSTFEIKERIASTFVSKEGHGRIFLAGDAAHVHSVNGGQGLNTGAADAFGLSWRIAALVNGDRLTPDAADKITYSYDAERRNTAQDVINVAARLVRDTMHTAKQYVGTIEKNAGYITGMGVAYDGMPSALLTESEKGIWKAGRRCPDLYLCVPRSNEAKRLYASVSYGRFLVFSVGAPQDASLRRFKDVTTLFRLFHNSQVPAEQDGEGATYGSDVAIPGEKFVVVVRPDMYIGCVGTEADAESYLSTIFRG